MMIRCTASLQQPASSLQHSPQYAYKGIQHRPKPMDKQSEQNVYTDLDHPVPNTMDCVLDEQPLYRTTDFLRGCRDFALDEEA